MRHVTYAESVNKEREILIKRIARKKERMERVIREYHTLIPKLEAELKEAEEELKTLPTITFNH